MKIGPDHMIMNPDQLNPPLLNRLIWTECDCTSAIVLYHWTKSNCVTWVLCMSASIALLYAELRFGG